MRIKLRYFASIREQLGIEEETIDCPLNSVAELRQQLINRGDNFASALSYDQPVRIARNHIMLFDENISLTDDDEIAFFPPVTGG